MKYRLKYFFVSGSVLAIDPIGGTGERKAGDYLIRAVKEDTDTDAHDREKRWHRKYTEAMTIEDVKKFLLNFGQDIVGDDAKRCFGISLEDYNNKEVLFDKPIVY